MVKKKIKKVNSDRTFSIVGIQIAVIALAINMALFAIQLSLELLQTPLLRKIVLYFTIAYSLFGAAFLLYLAVRIKYE
jgi:hypothetical protein